MIFDFTGTTGTELNAWNALLVKHSFSGGGSATINSSGRAVIGSTAGSYFHSETKSSPDYPASADLYFPDTTNTSVSVAIRMRTDQNTMYHARYSGGTVNLYKLNSGTQIQLGTGVAVTVNAGETHNIKLVGNGTTISVQWDGVEKISVTDSSISAAGVAGIRFNASQTTQVDNFNSDAGASASSSAVFNSTTANAVGAYTAKVVPIAIYNATTAGVSGSFVVSTGAAHVAFSATTAGASGAFSATGTASGASFVSEALFDYAGNRLNGVSLNFVRIYDDATGNLLVTKTGLVTNSLGVFSFSDVALSSGTTYRIDWETAAGQRRMPRKAAA